MLKRGFVTQVLLDNEFVEAYASSMVVNCANRVRCRIFPHIFTYSAEYPEKCIAECLQSHNQYATES